MTAEKTIDDVRSFWNNSPLFAGESRFAVGSREYFEEHRAVSIADGMAGTLDPRALPPSGQRDCVLDLGCGPGFWLVELARLGCKRIIAADISTASLALARERCEIYGVSAEFHEDNAERLSFRDGTFSHVNCHGVIHHSPDTARCVAEIARVLQHDGTACISVYYRNIYLSSWPVLRWAARVLAFIGARLLGRGRETIYTMNDVDDVVRMYDGATNPIGKAYSKRGFLEILTPHFIVDETFLHLFPARTLPFRLPRFMHRMLDRHTGFMIYARVHKRSAATSP